MTNSFAGDPDPGLAPAGKPPPWRGYPVLVLALVASMGGLAVGWSYVASSQLDAAVVEHHRTDPGLARELFDALRSRVRDSLRSECTVLVEDPRLKSTLATEGIDPATVTDILADLQRLRATGFLLVLGPDGRVFAESGAAELRNLDLSGSGVVKRAQGARGAIHGSWVIGKKLIDLGISAVQLEGNVFGYLVAGREVDIALTRSVASGTRVALAVLVGNDIVVASSDDPVVRHAAETIARKPPGPARDAVEVDGTAYTAAVFELEGTGQAVARLVALRPLAEAEQAFSLLHRLIWMPPVLILITIIFSLSRVFHRDRRVS